MPEPYYADDLVTLRLGDCRDVMAAMDAASVDAVACDPPYELGFMGRSWDASGIAYDVGVWREALRVLKPGGHLLAFGGTRTYHRLACAVEDAGFEIRDSLHWMYGSGFPKSLDVSKAIDKAAGAERKVVGSGRSGGGRRSMNDAPGNGRARDYLAGDYDVTAPATGDAARWSGWGTALKPAHEPIVVARKPLAGTVAGNVLEWGTGALNIDGCRVEGPAGNGHWIRNGEMGTRGIYGQGGQAGEDFGSENPAGGRWPPNLLLVHDARCQPAGTRRVRASAGGDGGATITGYAQDAYTKQMERGERGTYADTDGLETVQAWACADGCPVAGLDGQSGISTSTGGSRGAGGQHGAFSPIGAQPDFKPGLGDTGGASRFFPQFTWDPEHDLPFMYSAKAPKSERPQAEGVSAHPTVKPLAVMRWLVRLVTPPGGLVLDPFAGTGTTGQACALEGFRCVLAERDPDSAELARVRLAKPVQQQMTLDLPALPTTE